jgi:hypothetical protein
MHLLPAILLLSLMSAAPEAPRPPCNAATRGLLWPSQANFDSTEAVRLFRDGELTMCIRGDWKFRWESLSVNVHHLGKRKRAATQAAR